ncbi:MAG: FAD-binding oxidoreductase [Bryobacteraceae bacterium]|nr:FAD-binding oxidoreductase [Bryobacteraceae bacterium]
MQARLIESKVIAPEVRHFVFEVPDVEHLPFPAGQFVSITRVVREKKITRAYSICCASDGNRFELCLNRVQDGHLSPFLFDLQPGDLVEMKGPLGQFVWRNPVSDSILVGTGTGIAPFRGMVMEYLRGGGDRDITLIFGVRHEESLLYREDFEQLAREYPNFHFLPTLTQPGPEWTGLTGRVQPHVLSALGDRRDVDVYICGLKAMVDDMRAQLKELGLDRKRIISEKYD